MTIVGDYHNIFDANTADRLVALEHLMIDVLGIAHRGQQVRGKVDSRFNSLMCECADDQ